MRFSKRNKAAGKKDVVVPVGLSLLLHALVIAALFVNFSGTAEPKRLKPPSYVKAKLIELDAKTPRPQPVLPPEVSQPKPDLRAKEEAEKKAARKKQLEKEQREKLALEEKEREKKAREKKAKAERDKKRREQEELDKKKAAEEAERQKKLAEEREKQRQQALREEREALLAEQYATQVQSVEQAIFQRIRDKWKQPPSARNGMKTELKISLLPNGMVTDVSIIKGSGNEAFDRSAVAAVRSVENFREVKELPIEVFNRNFRPLYIDFNPQNLRL